MAARKKARAAYGSGGRPRLRKDGRWVAFAPYTNPRTGKRDRHPSYGRTADEAAAKRAEFLRRDKAGEAIIDVQMTLGAWLEQWLALVVSSSVGDSQKLSRENAVRRHILPHSIAQAPVGALKPIQIEVWLGELRTKFDPPASGRGDARSVQIAFDTLKRALTKAAKNGLLGGNPADDVDRPQYYAPEKRIPSDEALDAFIDSLQGSFLFPIVSLIVATGLRRGEALALAWDDIDFERSTLTVRSTERKIRRADGRESITVGKNGKTYSSARTLPLHPEVVQLIKTHRRVQEEARVRLGELWRDEGWVFTTQVGSRLRGRHVLNTLKKRAAKFGMADEVQDLHSLRHHFATTGLAAGVDAPALSKSLGHSRVSTTTDIYGHATPEGMARAAEAGSPSARRARVEARAAKRPAWDDEAHGA